jgi:hypothetical protein
MNIGWRIRLSGTGNAKEKAKRDGAACQVSTVSD